MDGIEVVKKASQVTVCLLFGTKGDLYGKLRLVRESQGIVCWTHDILLLFCVSLRSSYVKFVVPDIWWSHLHSTLHKSAPKQLVLRFLSELKGREKF